MNALTSAVRELEEVASVWPVVVRDNNGFKGVFAKADIIEDSVIFHLKGTISRKPSKYTIELSRHRHLNFPKMRRENDDLDYCWQYLNHNCEPNGYIDTVAQTFRALRNIGQGEQITFNYLTTESAMAVPFECICGSPNCFGFIQGRDFLTASQLKTISSGLRKLAAPTAPLFQKSTADLQKHRPLA